MAKGETAEVEKKLKAEIESLKKENQLQKVAADNVAKKMLEWTNLASELNHKMEGTISGLIYSRFLRVTLFPGYSVFAGLLLFRFCFVLFCLSLIPVSLCLLSVACLPTEDLSLLSDISPESQDAAAEAILAARREKVGHEAF